MAVPTLATDLTMIADADSGSSWSGWGQNSAKWSDESDIYIEGGGSQGLQPFSTGDGGWGYPLSTAIDLSATGDRLFIWVYTTPGFINTSSNYGVYVRICSSTSDWTTDYQDYMVGGSDVEWVGRGWHLIALDCSQTPTRTSGTTTLTNINRVGVGFTHTNTANKSTVTAIDVMYYGTYVEATSPTFTDATNGIDFNENGASDDTIDRNDGGSWITDGYEQGDRIRVYNTADNDGVYIIKSLTASVLTLEAGSLTADNIADTDAIVDAYITFEDIYEKDGPTDDDWYGIVTKNPLGLWEINYTLYIGDQSGSGRTHFWTRGEVIYFADQWLVSGELAIVTAEDTGITVFEVGDSSGTGDNRVGFSGSVFSQDNDFHGSAAKVDLDAAIEECFVYGATFLGIAAGLSFAADTSHKVFNCIFDRCGQVDLGSVEARNLTFSGYDASTDAALLWNSSIDIKNSSFLANRNASVDAHAVEHAAAGTYGYTGLSFAGNDYDINNSSNATQVDAYAESNKDGDVDLYSGAVTRAAQSFVGTAGKLSRAIFYLQKVGSPTGNVVAKLYSDATGPGTVLATSNNVATANVDIGAFNLVEFEFEDEYTLVASTTYWISVEYSGGDASNRIEVGYDGSTPGHSGACETYSGSWSSQTYDLCFYVNRDGVVVINATDSDPTTDEITGSPVGATIINVSYTITVNTVDSDNDPVSAVTCAIFLSADDSELMNKDSNASGVATENVTETGDVYWRVRESPAAGSRYVPQSGVGTIGSSGFSVTVIMRPDPLA